MAVLEQSMQACSIASKGLRKKFSTQTCMDKLVNMISFMYLNYFA